MTALLDVQNLSLEFRSPGNPPIAALQDVSFTLDRGETLAVLGESGSGKSITAKAIMGILPKPASRITGGRIMFDGDDLLSLPAPRLRRVQGARIAMVFQDALSALNPVQTVSTQIAELYRVHRGMGKKQAHAAAVEMMRAVRIPDAAHRADDYPFQFSGGMRQRIMIAMALALDPDVLIADEPTTALDATVQAQILELLGEITERRRMALLMITHDLGVAGQLADRALVMYAGRVAESGPSGACSTAPRTRTPRASWARSRAPRTAAATCRRSRGCRPTSRGVRPAAASTRAAGTPPRSAARGCRSSIGSRPTGPPPATTRRR